MKKYTLQEVADIVDTEGLGYAITDYTGSDSIEDEELSKLWKEAEEVLGKINKILEPYFYMGEDEE